MAEEFMLLYDLMVLSGFLGFCLGILASILVYWSLKSSEESLGRLKRRMRRRMGRVQYGKVKEVMRWD